MFSIAYIKSTNLRVSEKNIVFCELPVILFDLYMKKLWNNIKFVIFIQNCNLEVIFAGLKAPVHFLPRWILLITLMITIWDKIYFIGEIFVTIRNLDIFNFTEHSAHDLELRKI